MSAHAIRVGTPVALIDADHVPAEPELLAGTPILDGEFELELEALGEEESPGPRDVFAA
jgi:hypothetical protein